MKRTNRSLSASSQQRPDFSKKMNQDFYSQFQAILSADFIVDYIITRGANSMYSRYVNQKFPKHIAETYTEYLYKLSSTFVMPHDIHNESNSCHKITEDTEPPRVRTDSYMTDRIKLHKKINPNVSGDISEFIDTEKHVLFNNHSERGSPSKRASLGGYDPNTRSQQNSSKGERMSMKSSLRNSKEISKDVVLLTDQSRISEGRAKSPALPAANTGVWVNKEEGSPSKVNTSASFRDSLEMTGGALKKKGQKKVDPNVLAMKTLQQDYDVVIVPIVKDSDMDASSSNREDIDGELRKAYFESMAKKKKDDEEEQEKQKKLLKAKRAVESIGRAGANGQPAYTYGYNAEIIRTKNTLSPLKKDLMIKPKFEVSVISKVIPKASPAASIHRNTLSTHHSMPNNNGSSSNNAKQERRGSGDQSSKFVEMLKGYGIKVTLDPKTYAPIITDDMIKELERKTKGKILDQIELKPGVKFIEPSPEKDKERIKERGLFMTQYDAQTGFPRITKKMYNKAKGASEIIEKHKIEEEFFKVNASHITPEPKPEVSDSRKESMDETDYNPPKQPNGRAVLQPLKNKPKLAPKSEKKGAEGDQEMTFAGKESTGKPQAKPVRTSSANPREAAKMPKPSHNTMRNPEQGGGKLDISLPLNSNLIERQRKEQLITKKNWRVRSSHRPDKSLLTGYERGTVSITSGRDTSFDISYAKNLNGTKQADKKEKTGDISRSNHGGDDSVHIENTKYLDLLEL